MTESLPATSKGKKRAFVIGGLMGQGAGVYLANWLLCSELESLGYQVSCFAPQVNWLGAPPKYAFKIITPWVNHGCRWDWPGRCLSWQARLQIYGQKPDVVIVLGVTQHARYLLSSGVANRIVIWELTNANAGNKFVDTEAVRLLGRCRGILSPSQTIDNNIREHYGYIGPILRLPFWIEDWQKPCPEPPDQFTTDFIYLGRRDLEKGLLELVRATAVLVRQFPQVRVLIAGPGAAEPYAALARELGVLDNLKFEFFKGRAEMLDALVTSRFLVLPSYHEGYPLVLLEAAQMGVPFVSTAVGSIPDVFGGTGAGLLCVPRDHLALAQAMQSLLLETPGDYRARRLAARTVFQRVSSRSFVREKLRQLLVELQQVEI